MKRHGGIALSRDYEDIAYRHWNLTFDGIQTVFDGGAGTGRFSILLARLGIKVTHFDISNQMLEKAQQIAAASGVIHRMEFVQGRLTDLGSYFDSQFDMVISFDAPVSYTYPRQFERQFETGLAQDPDQVYEEVERGAAPANYLRISA